MMSVFGMGSRYAHAIYCVKVTPSEFTTPSGYTAHIQYKTKQTNSHLVLQRQLALALLTRYNYATPYKIPLGFNARLLYYNHCSTLDAGSKLGKFYLKIKRIFGLARFMINFVD